MTEIVGASTHGGIRAVVERRSTPISGVTPLGESSPTYRRTNGANLTSVSHVRGDQE